MNTLVWRLQKAVDEKGHYTPREVQIDVGEAWVELVDV
jgi:hypothetical protein